MRMAFPQHATTPPIFSVPQCHRQWHGKQGTPCPPGGDEYGDPHDFVHFEFFCARRLCVVFCVCFFGRNHGLSFLIPPPISRSLLVLMRLMSLILLGQANFVLGHSEETLAKWPHPFRCDNLLAEQAVRFTYPPPPPLTLARSLSLVFPSDGADLVPQRSAEMSATNAQHSPAVNPPHLRSYHAHSVLAYARSFLEHAHS